jgi:hypothetical protein
MTLRALSTSFAAAATLLAAGCTTPAYVSPVEVTRFTGAAPAQLGRGTIAVVPAPGDTGADSLEFGLYQQAVAAELGRLGYNVVRSGAGGGQVAEISLERGLNPAVGGGGRQSPVSVGVGGGTGGWGGGGVGLGVGINLGGGRGRSNVDELYRQLRVQIRPASGATPLWEGRAHFTASSNSDYAGEQAAAGKLAQALFAGFPGESGATTEVR